MNEWEWNTRARKNDKSPPLIQRIVIEEPVDRPTGGALSRYADSEELRRKQRMILQEREGLEPLELSLQNLNQRIERLEKITTKWKERGGILDTRS